ncbi:hypothetical protein ACFWNK_13510 [Streptomyces sp. NPDC058417]|uniref:hypothetical protein n=1 Tax=unclassified Streptomyces TaxID=2593676 RepID=UPI0036601139
MYWAADATLTEFQQNLIIALGGTLVGVLGTMAIEYVKARREPTRRLSYDAETRTAIVSAAEQVRPLLGLTYDGRPVEDLSSVEFTVENTGNRVIQEQQLRFRFADGSEVLDAEATSAHEAEWGVLRRPDLEQGVREAVFAIGHLERGQRVTFRLLASGRDSGRWEVVPHNPLGDVDLRERSTARMKEDREHMPAFFALSFLLLAVPPLFPVFGVAGDLAVTFVRAGLLAAILPHLAPTARALRDVLVRPQQPGHVYRFHGDVHGTALAFGPGGIVTYTEGPPGTT